MGIDNTTAGIFSLFGSAVMKKLGVGFLSQQSKISVVQGYFSIIGTVDLGGKHWGQNDVFPQSGFLLRLLKRGLCGEHEQRRNRTNETIMNMKDTS